MWKRDGTIIDTFGRIEIDLWHEPSNVIISVKADTDKQGEMIATRLLDLLNTTAVMHMPFMIPKDGD